MFQIKVGKLVQLDCISPEFIEILDNLDDIALEISEDLVTTTYLLNSLRIQEDLDSLIFRLEKLKIVGETLLFLTFLLFLLLLFVER